MTDADKRDIEARNKRPVLVHGSAGGVFNIDGPGLGSAGTLTIGGKAIVPKRWEDRTIRGVLPDDVSGEVVLVTETGTRRGVFPYSPGATPTTKTVGASVETTKQGG